jgi:hypothetical protein
MDQLVQEVQALRVLQEAEHQEMQALRVFQEAEHQEMQALRVLQEAEHQEVQALRAEVHHLTSTTTTAADLAKRHLPDAIISNCFLPNLRAAINWADLLADAPRLSISSHPSSSSTVSGSKMDKTDAASSDEPRQGRKKASSLSQSPSSSSPSSLPPSLHISEAEVQRWWVRLLQYLKDKYLFSLHFHDTSASGLTKPYAKIDVTVTPAGITSSPTWSDVVTLFELKASLHSTTDYETAVGQVIERCHEIFRCQRQRPHVIAAVVGAEHIDFLRIDRDNRILHTGVVALALTQNNPGIDWLIRMLSDPLDHFSYKLPVRPPDFVSHSSGNTYGNYQLLHSHHSSAPHDIVSPRGSEVYACSSANGSAVRDVVIKFNGPDDVQNEGIILNRLHGLGCLHIPALVEYGVSPPDLPPQFRHYLVVKPRGEHLRQDDPPSLICSVLSDVCDAMLFAYEKCDKLLHRDLSFGNVVYCQTLGGLLIDWHVAAPELPSFDYEASITGTLMFTSPYLAEPSHKHDLLDDLVSLFFVLMFIASGEKLPWRRELGHPNAVYDRKIALLSSDVSFQYALKECTERMKPVLSAVRAELVRIDGLGVRRVRDVQKVFAAVASAC